MGIRLYEVNQFYINYLSQAAKHLFHNKKSTERYERKFVA